MPKTAAAGPPPAAPSPSGQTSRLRIERLDLLNQTASELAAQARLTQARDILLGVLDRDPENVPAYLHLAVVYESMGSTEDSMAAFARAQELDPDNAMLASASVFANDRLPDATLEDGYRIRRRFNDLITRRMPPILPHTNLPAPERKLRVGYVSGDMRHHSAARVFGVPLMNHDPDQFEVAAYMTLAGADWMTDQIRAKVDQWRDASTWSPERLYQQIRSDQIDILVDLSGHSGGNRLQVFARKPAPVQVTAWGYATGTGLDAMDYFFADTDTVYPDEHQWYSEEIVYLPRIVSFWPISPEVVGPVAPLPALRNGYITYGVLNRLGKLKLQSIELWARILKEVPDARLLIKAHGLEHPDVRAMLQARFEQFGTNLAQLQFRGSSNSIEHHQTYNEVDVCLDPVPDGGGVSTLEGLWMGVPAVTLPQKQIASRLTTSFQKELGLPWLVASSADEYVERAVQLNAQRGELAQVRRLLRDLMCVSALCNTKVYLGAVEDAYRAMWVRWCNQRNGVAAHPAPALTLVGA